jgi:hypothetical protein
MPRVRVAAARFVLFALRGLAVRAYALVCAKCCRLEAGMTNSTPRINGKYKARRHVRLAKCSLRSAAIHNSTLCDFSRLTSLCAEARPFNYSALGGRLGFRDAEDTNYLTLSSSSSSSPAPTPRPRHLLSFSRSTPSTFIGRFYASLYEHSLFTLISAT